MRPTEVKFERDFWFVVSRTGESRRSSNPEKMLQGVFKRMNEWMQKNRDERFGEWQEGGKTHQEHRGQSDREMKGVLVPR